MSKDRNLIKISRISPDKAESLIPVSEDQLNTPAYYYTITPSTSKQYRVEDGWEDVTYYTNRSRNIAIPKGIVNCQYIYILTNDTMPGLVKIGFTKNKPSERVKQINAATGVPLDFEVKYQYPCFNAHDLEQEIHRYLENELGNRTNRNKEFFNMTVEQAISVIERIGEPYKMTDESE